MMRPLAVSTDNSKKRGALTLALKLRPVRGGQRFGAGRVHLFGVEITARSAERWVAWRRSAHYSRYVTMEGAGRRVRRRVMSYGDIQWLPLTAGLTVLGLLLSYVIMRRSGVRPALRIAAVSLLPIAAYLTGATEMLWKIGTAIGQFGTGFAFSTTEWVGIGVTGLAIALFLAAGGREARRGARDKRRAARA